MDAGVNRLDQGPDTDVDLRTRITIPQAAIQILGAFADLRKSEHGRCPGELMRLGLEQIQIVGLPGVSDSLTRCAEAVCKSRQKGRKFFILGEVFDVYHTIVLPKPSPALMTAMFRNRETRVWALAGKIQFFR